MLARSNLVLFVAIAVLAGWAGAHTIRPALDHDTWWHLRIGQFVANTRSVPEVDPISHMGIEGAVPWQAYSWLYEWLLFRCWEIDGNSGVLWFRTVLAALSTATVFAWILARNGRTIVSFAMLAGVAIPLMPMATERPWHFTIAFTAVTIWAVQSIRERDGVRPALWLIPLFALWANLHIQFVLGWLVLGLACVDPGRANRRQVLALAVGCGLATFANPYHMQLIPVIWDYATQAAPRAIIYELSPPDWLDRWSLAVMGLVMWAVVNLVARRSFEPFAWGLLLAGAYFASRMNRDLWFGALAAASVIRSSPSTHGVAGAGAQRSPGVGERCPQITSIFATVIAAYFALRILNSVGLLGDRDTEAAHARIYPVKAVEFLRESKPAGPLFNDLSWGGYLAWSLEEYPVTIDGRTNLYGNERLAQSSKTWSTLDGWKTDTELAKCNVILAQKGRPFTESLREMTSDWRLVYEDGVAAVFVRTKP